MPKHKQRPISRLTLAALLLSGNSTVKVKGSTVAGKVEVKGSADLVKQGGNTFSKR